MSLLKSITVLSIEQATTLPYMTLKLAEEGARVIRIENPPYGDPNRWVGPKVLPDEKSGNGFEEGMNAYFLPNNLGKQSITLNLGKQEGKDLLYRLIRELPVDIFATNQRPKSLKKLGVDYDTLKEIKSDLIWLSITGFGPESNEAAYDPILQARTGLMSLTGDPDGDPMVFGLPIVDLGAGEHAYGEVMKALYKREVSGEGSQINVSMFQSAVSWAISPAMLSNSFDMEIKRKGNTHRFFAPVSVYPTEDGNVYLAIGNDKQWEAMMMINGFEKLNSENYKNNEGRISDVSNLNQAIARITCTYKTSGLVEQFQKLGIPISPVNSLLEACQDPLISDKLVRSFDPISNKNITIPPPAVISDHLLKNDMRLSFPPRLGEDNEAVYGILNMNANELKTSGVI